MTVLIRFEDKEPLVLFNVASIRLAEPSVAWTKTFGNVSVRHSGVVGVLASFQAEGLSQTNRGTR